MNRLRTPIVLMTGLLTSFAVAAAPQPPAQPDRIAAMGDAIGCTEYQYSIRADGSISAPNRSQDLRSFLSDRGLHLESRTRGEAAWSMDIGLSRFGREEELSPVDPVKPTVEKNRATLLRSNITEWYVNDFHGLEQGFDIAKAPPAGRSGGRLVVAMRVTSGLRGALGEDRRSILFRSGAGEDVIRYGDLKVTDSRGAELQADLGLEGDSLSIRVNDNGAVYPIRIDPLVSSPAWTTSGTQGSELLGFSVASAGDVNNDGYADIIVGAPLYDGGCTDEGRAFLFFGSSAGPIASSWVPVHHVQCVTNPKDLNAQFGYAVASAGDVNGDGFDDVIVGAPFEDNPSLDEGRVYIYHGSSSSTGLGNTAARILEKDQASARFGISVASGHFNSNDNYSDIVVGAENYQNGETGEGRVWVWKGSASGIPNSDSAHWRAEINQQDAFFGHSVASAGDVDGDGDDEVLVGALQYDSGETNEGAAFLWEGGPNGLGNNNGTEHNYDFFAQINQANALFGGSVASAGDVNADGFDDVIIGAELYGSAFGQDDEGAAFVWYGSGGGLVSNGTPANANWSAESNQINTLGPAGFGGSVASAGDVNNDGYGDIIIGSKTYSNGSTIKGAVFLWQGSVSGLGANGTPANATQKLEGEPTQFDIPWFGASVAGAGDVDNDGFDDVLVGAPQQDTSLTNGGRAYLYRGNANPCTVLCQTTWCKFQDFLCTADINCQGACCNYTNCTTAACSPQACPPNACPGTCP